MGNLENRLKEAFKIGDNIDKAFKVIKKGIYHTSKEDLIYLKNMLYDLVDEVTFEEERRYL